ncbi:MAG: glycoside hydrolase family 2 protein [Chthoniobacterales bacterium]
MRTRTFLPRPEYPRPDRQRGFVQGVDWLNLNGPWEFRFDPERVGIAEEWFRPDEKRWPDQMIVPFCWESLAAWGEADAAGNDNYFCTRVYRNPLEVTRENYRSAERYEVGWYRRDIRVPSNDAWRGRRVILTVGAADFFTTAWCNGRELGSNEEGFTPFEFDLTDALDADSGGGLSGLIVFRVEDPMRNQDQPVGKQWGWYSSASGIWQTVFLEPRARGYIDRFEVTTDIQNSRARFHIAVVGIGDPGRGDAGHGPGSPIPTTAEVAIEITSPVGEVFTEVARVWGGEAVADCNLGTAVLWDPNAPELYRVKLTLAGEPPDIVHGYFGMRSLAAVPVEESGGPGTLNLNGEPIYLRGALYQSYHAEGVYTAGDLQAVRDDIISAKQAGFDLLRIHIKVDDPLVLYCADTLGILLMCDFPNFGEGGDNEVGRRRYETMMRRAMARDFNHPSIVAWCLFNETWGFGGQSEFVKLINPAAANLDPTAEPRAIGTRVANEGSYTWVQEMWKLAKALDPTRLIEDMSVVAWDHLAYYGHGDTDVNSWHFYTKDYEHARRQIIDVVEKTYAGSTFNYVEGFQQGSQPLINSEYGGVGALDGDIDTSWSFKFLTNELRRQPKLSAYIYTELHDVEWERNGFLNYDRTPKEFGFDPTIVNQGDVLPIDAAPIQRCSPGQTLEVDVFSSHFSRRRRENVTLHWRLSGIDSLGWMHDDLASGIEAIGFPYLKVELAKRLELRMPRETMLCTLWVRAYAADGSLVARNYVQFFIDARLPEREENNGRTILRLEPHLWHAADWNKTSSTRETASEIGASHGASRGWFEWRFPFTAAELRSRSRLTVLCEASAFREGAPQTDSFAQPTTLRIVLNGISIQQMILPNHPHDARGALTYLSGGDGGYGYLTHGRIEGELLRQVVGKMKEGHLRLRCLVPREETIQGGLTIYGSSAGRYPIPPTLIIE